MATVGAAPVVEDDEAWLYGGKSPEAGDAPANSTGTPAESSSQLSATAPEFTPKGNDTADTNEADASREEGEEFDDDDDEEDSDDDDVQVTIGAIKTSYEPRNLFKGGTYQKTPGKPGMPTKGVDLDAVGEVKGTNIYEFDLATLEEKPWRKPGADITDYFNYGFNEETWEKYCDRQKFLRNSEGPKKIFVHHAGSAPIRQDNKIGGNIVLTGQPTMVPPGMTNMIPMRKMSGSIDVVSSRRQDENQASTISTLGATNPPPTSWADPSRTSAPVSYQAHVPPPGIPTHVPQGTMMAGPPPGYHRPPPGMPPPSNMPPPHHMPPNVPPPVFRGPPPDGYFRPPAPPGFNPYGGAPPPFNQAPPMAGGPSPWERPPSFDPYSQGPPSPNSDSSLSEEDDKMSHYSRSERDRHSPSRKYESRRRESDRDLDRSRDRDAYSQSRDRDRDRERSRTRDRDPDRDRDRSRDQDRDRDRDRERRHRKRRHRDEEDRERHRHKRSKRSRREKEDGETAPPEEEQGEEKAE